MASLSFVQNPVVDCSAASAERAADRRSFPEWWHSDRKVSRRQPKGRRRWCKTFGYRPGSYDYTWGTASFERFAPSEINLRKTEVGFTLARFSKFLFQLAVARVKLQRSLISPSGAGFLLRFHVTIADTFETVDARQLFLISG